MRLTPRAAADGIAGTSRDAAGESWLCVRVRAVPEHGKANAALCRLVAKALAIAVSDVTIASGRQSRHKRLRLVARDGLEDRLQNLADG